MSMIPRYLNSSTRSMVSPQSFLRNNLRFAAADFQPSWFTINSEILEFMLEVHVGLCQVNIIYINNRDITSSPSTQPLPPYSTPLQPWLHRDMLSMKTTNRRAVKTQPWWRLKPTLNGFDLMSRKWTLRSHCTNTEIGLHKWQNQIPHSPAVDPTTNVRASNQI